MLLRRLPLARLRIVQLVVGADDGLVHRSGVAGEAALDQQGDHGDSRVVIWRQGFGPGVVIVGALSGIDHGLGDPVIAGPHDRRIRRIVLRGVAGRIFAHQVGHVLLHLGPGH